MILKVGKVKEFFGISDRSAQIKALSYLTESTEDTENSKKYVSQMAKMGTDKAIVYKFDGSEL